MCPYLSFQLLAELCYCLLKPVCRILVSNLNCFFQVSVTGVALLAVLDHLTADLVNLEKEEEGGESGITNSLLSSTVQTGHIEAC